MQITFLSTSVESLWVKCILSTVTILIHLWNLQLYLMVDVHKSTNLPVFFETASSIMPRLYCGVNHFWSFKNSKIDNIKCKDRQSFSLYSLSLFLVSFFCVILRLCQEILSIWASFSKECTNRIVFADTRERAHTARETNQRGTHEYTENF